VEDDDALMKRLWLRIAKHVVEKEQGRSTAMEFLRQCDLIKIDDILPLFQNFEVIDVFRVCLRLFVYLFEFYCL